jgi:hypothetical protein
MYSMTRVFFFPFFPSYSPPLLRLWNDNAPQKNKKSQCYTNDNRRPYLKQSNPTMLFCVTVQRKKKCAPSYNNRQQTTTNRKREREHHQQLSPSRRTTCVYRFVRLLLGAALYGSAIIENLSFLFFE